MAIIRVLIFIMIMVFSINLFSVSINPEKPYILSLFQSGKNVSDECGGNISSDGLNFTTWIKTDSGYIKCLWSQKNLKDAEPKIKVKREIPDIIKVLFDSNHCNYSLGFEDRDSQAYYFDMNSGKGSSLFTKTIIEENKMEESNITFLHEESKLFFGSFFDYDFICRTFIYNSNNGIKILRLPDKDSNSGTLICDLSGDSRVILLKSEQADSFYAYFLNNDKYQKLPEVESVHISQDGSYICAVSAKGDNKYLTRWKYKGDVYEQEKLFSNKYKFISDPEPILSPTPLISNDGDIAEDLFTKQGNVSIMLLKDMESPVSLNDWIKSMLDLQWDEKIPVKQIKNSVIKGVYSEKSGIMVLLDIVSENKNYYPVKLFVPKTVNK